MSKPTLIVYGSFSPRWSNGIFRICRRLGVHCERRDYDRDSMLTPRRDQVHLLWTFKDSRDAYKTLSEFENVYFGEQGWLTQRDGCYIDHVGIGAMSSICHGVDGPVSEDQASQVTDFIHQLHQRLKVKPVVDEKDYLFLPLQVDGDRNITCWSNCDAHPLEPQVWFVDQVCRAFPDERIIIRPHPYNLQLVKDMESQCPGFRGHPNVVIRSDRTTYDWIAGAKAVVGINSTVLLEALTFYKPVCAMGDSFFTGNSVVLECQGNPTVLQQLPNYTPNPDRITAFLHLLIQRQIPYQLLKENAARFPIFTDMIACAHRIANS